MTRTPAKDVRVIFSAATVALVAACNLLVPVPDIGSPDGSAGGVPDAGPPDGMGDVQATSETSAPIDGSVPDGGASPDGNAAPDTGKTLPAPATVLAADRSVPLALAVDQTNGAVYWTEQNGGVFKVGADGGTVTTLKAPDDAGASAGRVATDGANVYWADAVHRTIAYVSVAGGSPSVLATSASPAGVATDGTFVYWSDLVDSVIYRTPILDPHPSAAQPLVGPSSGATRSVLGIAVAFGRLVWAEQYFYFHWLLLSPGGGGAVPVTSGIEENHDAEFVAADDLGAYWSESGSTQSNVYVARYGPKPQPQAIGWTEDSPSAVAVTAGHDAYWVVGGSTNAIRRARYDPGSSGWTAETIAGASSPTAIGVDSHAVYWANGVERGSIERVLFADLP